jgi:hypothetical protein
MRAGPTPGGGGVDEGVEPVPVGFVAVQRVVLDGRDHALGLDAADRLGSKRVDRGEIRPEVDADWEASALVAYLDGIRLQLFYSGNRLSLDAAVQRYFDLLVERLAI